MSSRIQAWLTKVLPASWTRSMEAESREWMMLCPCGAATSVWDAGGVRWKAKGSPRHLARCKSCGQRTLHRLERSPGQP